MDVDSDGQSDQLRQQASSSCEQAQLLADRLLSTVREESEQALVYRGKEFSVRVARLPEAVSLIRHEFRRWLDLNDVPPEDVLDITLACSEACANAVEHPSGSGNPAFEFDARCDNDELFVAVRDFGAWTPFDETSLRGRGLSMIRRVMDDVEINSHGEGTEIVMRRSLHPVG